MFTQPTDEEYRWIARQRPWNKRMNRILLRNSKRKATAGTVANHKHI